MLGLQNEREWRAFCEGVLLQPALASDPRFDSNAKRNANREALQALILQTFAALSTAQVLERARRGADRQRAHERHGGALAAPAAASARSLARGRSRRPEPIPALLPPGRQSAFDYRMDAVPAVGEHTEAILRSLGRSEADIESLRAAEAI